MTQGRASWLQRHLLEGAGELWGRGGPGRRAPRAQGLRQAGQQGPRAPRTPQSRHAEGVRSRRRKPATRGRRRGDGGRGQALQCGFGQALQVTGHSHPDGAATVWPRDICCKGDTGRLSLRSQHVAKRCRVLLAARPLTAQPPLSGCPRRVGGLRACSLHPLGGSGGRGGLPHRLWSVRSRCSK